MSLSDPGPRSAEADGPLGTGLPQSIGPILFARGARPDECRLTALTLAPSWVEAPVLRTAASEIRPARLAEFFGWSAWGYDFALPAAAGASYELGGRRYRVAADMGGDIRIAFVSCNGQEEGDGNRPIETRNLMWRRLCEEHKAKPFSLMIHGGDQLYADEALASHPEILRWREAPMRHKPGIRFTPEMEAAARRWYAGRYLALAAEPAMAELVASIPSLMMWDDHDIMDGWGSHPAAVQESAVGRGIFAVAREMFMLFQLGIGAGDISPLAPDPGGRSFTLGAAFPRLRVIAPDLRSERTMTQVMGPAGWQAFERALKPVRENERVLVVSSVPALGPRLSLVERLMNRIPKMQDYEDDLRDQWQSFAHRLEWQRFLKSMEDLIVERGAGVTALSGEIHLATRGEMRLPDGRALHQLVASGISHPEPSVLYAGSLALLARLGEAPLPGRPIRMRALPGKRSIYTAERNYLVLERVSDRWAASWELEKSGRTPSLEI